MLDKMHDHLMKELALNRQLDTGFVVLGIVFNLMMLGINSAAQSSKDYSLLIVFFVLGAVVTAIAVAILAKGKDSRGKLVNGLLAMYEDSGVSKYFDRSLIKNDEARSSLEMAAVLATAAVSIIVPIILKLVYKASV